MEPNVKRELARGRVEDLLREARRERGIAPKRTSPRRPAPRHEAGPWS